MSSENSYNRQEWEYIWGVGILAFLTSWIALSFWFWNYYNTLPHVVDFKGFIHPVITSLSEYLLNGSSASFINYFNSAFQNNKVLDIILHIGLPFILAIAIGYVIGRIFYIEGGLDGLIHISGPKLLNEESAIQHANLQYKRNKSKPGLILHPQITLPQHEENGNILVIGNHGAGKSALLTPLFHQIIERQAPAFIFDYKKEFTSYFYSPTKTILVAIGDERATPWNISADIDSEERATKITTQLIPESGSDPIWTNGSRQILTGMIIILLHRNKPWGWNELAELLTSDIQDLKKDLDEHYPLARNFVIDQENKMTLSFMATLLSYLGWIISLARAWPHAYENGFSITEWVHNSSSQKPILIVQHSYEFDSIAAPLVNAMIQLMYTLLTTLSNTPNKEIWLLIDELGHLPKCSTLESWLSTGRSYGARTIIGTQTLSKVLNIYGENTTHAILDLFEILFVMRLSGSATADYIVKRFGERKVKRRTSLSSINKRPFSEEQIIPLIKTSDLIHLEKPRPFRKRPINAFLMIQGWSAVYKLTFPFSKLKSKVPEFIPSNWISKIDKTEKQLKESIVINPLAELSK